jgi:hypothetical protein
MSDHRAAALAALLARTGWDKAERMPLAGDASTRAYERLRLGDLTAILMDAPAKEDAPCPPEATVEERKALGWNARTRLAASRVEAFAAVGAYLGSLGLSAPAVYGLDAAAGFALLEDLGESLYAAAIPQGASETALYARAGEVLAAAQAVTPPAVLEGPGGSWPLLAFDALALETYMDVVQEWLPQATAVRFSDRDGAAFKTATDRLIAEAAAYPRVLTIRDYHAENLLWLPERPGLKAVGLLDYQDAVLGFRGWDLSMLLHDARRDVSPGAAQAALEAYLAASGADRAAVGREIAVLGALNILRILGIFARLVTRDSKPRYAGFMPRMWGHLRGVLRHPDLADLSDFMHRVAGPELESAP